MVVVTTIYCMEIEAVKKVPAQQPTEEPNENARDDGREFLGIYQGKQGQENRE